MNKIVLTLPSKGSLGQASMDFLGECGFPVSRASDRQYTGAIKALGIDILFQRAEDIPQKIREGTAHIGITGLDIVEEQKIPYDPVRVIIHGLSYGKANLVLAVPESWIHISSIYDLADLSAKWSLDKQSRNIRIATKFKKLTEKFLQDHNIYNYKLIDVSGVLEITPQLKIADIIIDLTSTGTTLRENHLKIVDNGTILKSEACLIGNIDIIKGMDNDHQLILEQFIDTINSRLRAREYIRVMTNIECINPEKIEHEIHDALLKDDIIINTFTLSQSLSLSNKNKSIVNINLVIQKKDLYRVIRILRRYSALEIASTKIDYLFLGESTYLK